MVDVLTATITCNVDTVYAGEPVTIYYNALLSDIVRPEDVDKYRVKIDVYINGKLVKTIYRDLYEGYDVVNGSLILIFDVPGDYNIALDINIVER